MLRRPYAAQLRRLYAVLRYLGCHRWFLALKQIYRQIPNSGAHCNGIIHRACAVNDLTSRSFSNYFWDTTLMVVNFRTAQIIKFISKFLPIL